MSLSRNIREVQTDETSEHGRRLGRRRPPVLCKPRHASTPGPPALRLSLILSLTASASVSRRDSRSLRLRLAALSPQGSASGLRLILHLILRLRLRRLRRTHSTLIPLTNLPQRLPSFYSCCAQEGEESVGNEPLHAPMKKPDWTQPVGSVSQPRTSVSQLY
eukprot:scaffold15316_cov69-Phaeocystis_antarctica.AAC.12